MLSSAAAAIAQLGERQTEDLKVPGSIPGLGTFGATMRCRITLSWRALVLNHVPVCPATCTCTRAVAARPRLATGSTPDMIRYSLAG